MSKSKKLLNFIQTFITGFDKPSPRDYAEAELVEAGVSKTEWLSDCQDTKFQLVIFLLKLIELGG